MHLSKVSDILSWRWTFLVDIFFAVIYFRLFRFSPIFSHLSTLCHFNSGEGDSRSRIMVPPGVGVLILQFYLLLLKYHLSLSLHILKREDILILHCVIRCRPENSFLYGCWVLPFARMITIGLLVLVTCNLMGASVSYAILFMPFEYVWTEATRACVFFIVLDGLRGDRWVLAKLYLMMLPYDTLKASHVSTRTYFMWWGWNLMVTSFSIHLD